MGGMSDLMQDIHRQQTLDMALMSGWQHQTLPRDQVPDHPGPGGVASDQEAARYLETRGHPEHSWRVITQVTSAHVTASPGSHGIILLHDENLLM